MTPYMKHYVSLGQHKWPFRYKMARLHMRTPGLFFSLTHTHMLQMSWYKKTFMGIWRHPTTEMFAIYFLLRSFHPCSEIDFESSNCVSVLFSPIRNMYYSAGSVFFFLHKCPLTLLLANRAKSPTKRGLGAFRVILFVLCVSSTLSRTLNLEIWLQRECSRPSHCRTLPTEQSSIPLQPGTGLSQLLLMLAESQLLRKIYREDSTTHTHTCYTILVRTCHWSNWYSLCYDTPKPYPNLL